jgi:hypothetical protein
LEPTKVPPKKHIPANNITVHKTENDILGVDLDDEKEEEEGVLLLLLLLTPPLVMLLLLLPLLPIIDEDDDDDIAYEPFDLDEEEEPCGCCLPDELCMMEKD